MKFSTATLRLFFLKAFARFYPEILIGSVLFVLAVGYLVFLRGGFQQIATLDRYNLESIKSDAAYLEGHLRSLQTLNEQYSRFNRSAMDNFSSILPPQPDLPGLLVQIEAITEQSGFVAHNIQFSGGGAAADGQAAGVPAASSGAIQLMDITTSVSGGNYTQLKTLLDNLESNIRLLDVASVNFSSAENGPYAIAMHAYYLPR